jgi:hypothetical protein
MDMSLVKTGRRKSELAELFGGAVGRAWKGKMNSPCRPGGHLTGKRNRQRNMTRSKTLYLSELRKEGGGVFEPRFAVLHTSPAPTTPSRVFTTFTGTYTSLLAHTRSPPTTVRQLSRSAGHRIAHRATTPRVAHPSTVASGFCARCQLAVGAASAQRTRCPCHPYHSPRANGTMLLLAIQQ